MIDEVEQHIFKCLLNSETRIYSSYFVHFIVATEYDCWSQTHHLENPSWTNNANNCGKHSCWIRYVTKLMCPRKHTKHGNPQRTNKFNKTYLNDNTDVPCATSCSKRILDMGHDLINKLLKSQIRVSHVSHWLRANATKKRLHMGQQIVIQYLPQTPHTHHTSKKERPQSAQAPFPRTQFSWMR